MKKLLTLILIAILSVSFALAAPSVSVSPGAINFGDVYPEKNKAMTFTISNNGDTTLTNLDFSSPDTPYTITFSPDSRDILIAGDSLEITATIRTPFEEEIKDNIKVGGLRIHSNQIERTHSDFFEMDSVTYLKLNFVRLRFAGLTERINHDGDTLDDEPKPMDNVKVEVDVENVFDKVNNQEIEINNVVPIITIKDIDGGDDIEMEGLDFDLDYTGNDQQHTFNMEFTVPVTAEDESYDIEIKLTGKDDNDRKYEILWNSELNVNREENEIIITDFDVSPIDIGCDGKTELKFEMINLGRSDEPKVRYKVESVGLDIFVEKRDIDLSSDPDDEDNIYSETISLSIGDAQPGSHALDFIVFRDFDTREEIRRIYLDLMECQSQQEEEPDVQEEDEPQQEEEPEEQETVEDDVQEEAQQEEAREEVLLYPPQQEAKSQNINLIGMPEKTNKESFRDSNAYIILIGVLNLAVIAGVVLAIIITKRK